MKHLDPVDTGKLCNENRKIGVLDASSKAVSPSDASVVSNLSSWRYDVMIRRIFGSSSITRISMDFMGNV
jgi:hypothetical protein